MRTAGGPSISSHSSLLSPACSRNKELVGARVIEAGLLTAVYGGAPLPPLGPTYSSAVLAASPDGSMLWANVTLALPPHGNDNGLQYVPPHVNAWQNSSRCPTEIGVSASLCGWFSIRGSDGRDYNASLVELPEPGSLVLALAAVVAPAVPGISVRDLRWNKRMKMRRGGGGGVRLWRWRSRTYTHLVSPIAG